MYLPSKGSPTSRVWVVTETPYDNDKHKGYLFSGSYGWLFDKMMKDAGFNEYYVIARRPDIGDRNSFTMLDGLLNQYQPPIIIALEEAGKSLCLELNKKVIRRTDGEDASEIEKYSGSLLVSDRLQYPHYVIPTLSPQTIMSNWSNRDICVSLDLGKAKGELDYWLKNGKLEPLPTRELHTDLNFAEICDLLQNRFMKARIISNDIETIYTNKKSALYPHPGYPVTIGLADSPYFGVSFNLFREDPQETLILWRLLDALFRAVPQLGQNFFNFDSYYYNALGFYINLRTLQDTIIRHHILWPELPHKLQFQTRQYTRQPYYKDEGKKWTIKNLTQLKHYNCLDVCVDMEVYLEQEKEFDERPHLR